MTGAGVAGLGLGVGAGGGNSMRRVSNTGARLELASSGAPKRSGCVRSTSACASSTSAASQASVRQRGAPPGVVVACFIGILGLRKAGMETKLKKRRSWRQRGGWRADTGSAQAPCRAGWAGSAGRACVPRHLTRSHYAIGLPASCNRWLAGRQCHCRSSPGVDHEKRRPLMSAAGVWGNDGACLAGAQAIKSLQRRSLEAGGLARGDAHQPVVALVDDRHVARQLDRLGVLGF